MTKTSAYEILTPAKSPYPAIFRPHEVELESLDLNNPPGQPQPTQSPSRASSSTTSLKKALLKLTNDRLASSADGSLAQARLDRDLIERFFFSYQLKKGVFTPEIFARLEETEVDSLRQLLCSIPSSQLQEISNPSAFSTLCLPSHKASSPFPYFRDQTRPQRTLHKRDLHVRGRSILPRQATQGNGRGPSAAGYPTCTAVSNAVLSCFPQSNTSIVQHTWSKFIWNNNYPTFIGARDVDIYLFNAQSETPVANWTSISNDRGMIGIYAGDDWFPPIKTWQNGRNISYPYFFVITNAGAPLTGGEQHQATFTAVQTAPQAAFVSASVASASLSSLTSLALPSSSPTSLQNGSSDDSFPKWEIALIVILGTFALLAFFIAAYLAFNNARRRRQIRLWHQSAAGGSTGSIGSNSPMIQNNEGAALMGNQKGGAAVASARDMNSPSSSRPGSPLSASVANANSMIPLAGDAKLTEKPSSDSGDATITSVDASIMADAFRKALRKPEFAFFGGRGSDTAHGLSVELEKQKEDHDATFSKRIRDSMHAQVVSLSDAEDDDRVEDEEAKEIMDRELASEGRSMTSVDNRRRPEVHS
ncbi:hypothetical protein BY996DRAFT_4581293 [Phakopsora pachyrhizi]|uniref:Expressed protein n=1 Tax=Phakopsora pachyrhizi TaxID=170000 RepID=A0AAV0AQA2_PHAPC|nr:hypothetical protein BY996DRAFT_4581293 [Phakopsora pachyrhizi]CAH7671377.1 expressed protein [Phakopsora pachyrhizi]